MTPTEITIKRPLATHLLGLAQQSPEREICGLVGAVEGKPTTVYPVENVTDTPATAFEMDPQGQISALKAMRARRETLFAIYHSHPGSPAVPSERDLENIGYPDVYQLIISLNTKGVLEMRAYRLNAGGVEEVELRV